MITSPRRAMTALRRSALLLLPALCALTSCGISTTGVVQAGGPASGIVARTPVYFVLDGRLIDVSRRTGAPGDVESALGLMLQGPTEAERRKGLTTQMPLLMDLATRTPAAPSTDEPTPVPRQSRPGSLMTVTTGNDEISVEISSPVGELSDLAAAQIICTATAAQRVTDPGTEPAPVNITAPDGRRIRGTSAQCPGR